MNLIKRIFIVLFVITLILYSGYRAYRWRSSDGEPPVISCSSDSIAVSVEASDEVLLEGVTAEDNRDGDVTSSLIVENMSQFVSDNKRIITYAAFDSANNVSKATREVSYTDYHSPRFQITAPLSYSYGSSINILDRIKAYDCLEGDITSKIKVGFSTPTAPGLYTATFKVTNGTGDTSSLTAEVNVYQADKTGLASTPVISLTDYLIYLNKGDELKPYSYLKDVTIGNSKYSISDSGDDSHIASSSINISGDVDTNEPGVYTLTYSLTRNGYRGSVSLMVIVE